MNVLLNSLVALLVATLCAGMAVGTIGSCLVLAEPTHELPPVVIALLAA